MFRYLSHLEVLLLLVSLAEFVVIVYFVMQQGFFSFSAFKFHYGQKVRHVKTGGIYKIVGLPHKFVLEHSREPAYAYKMKDGRTCVRSQAEMEDGRFVPAYPNIVLNERDDG